MTVISKNVYINKLPEIVKKPILFIHQSNRNLLMVKGNKYINFFVFC